ncbi:MAG: tetratricopeptide repeat protein [Burkholderiaceae bacterium]|nr:tetratricopeptide repeat protein [Burkholderiaceae bacterium]
MATSLDLEEQEQLDQLKHFWRTYGNLITWTITLCLVAYAGWMGWQWWQRDQAAKAGGMFGELDRAVQVGDLERSSKVLADLRERFPSTTYAAQAALLTARLQVDKGQLEAARGTLGWAVEKSADDEYRSIARLRLAGVLMDQKKFDEALAQLGTGIAEPFAALAADRRGDILMAQGKREEAATAYRQAYDALQVELDYRRLVEAKLVALGAAPAPAASASASAASAAGAKP